MVFLGAIIATLPASIFHPKRSRWTETRRIVELAGANAALAYAAGEALFDARNPAHLLEQADEPVLKPAAAYEKTGQYAAGTTFAEGLVYFHNRWLLYYGCADSLVAVVMAPGR